MVVTHSRQTPRIWKVRVLGTVRDARVDTVEHRSKFMAKMFIPVVGITHIECL